MKRKLTAFGLLMLCVIAGALLRFRWQSVVPAAQQRSSDAGALQEMSVSPDPQPSERSDVASAAGAMSVPARQSSSVSCHDLRVQLRDDSGKAIAGARVAVSRAAMALSQIVNIELDNGLLEPVDSAHAIACSRTNAEGVAVLRDLPAGPWMYRVHSEHHIAQDDELIEPVVTMPMDTLTVTMVRVAIAVARLDGDSIVYAHRATSGHGNRSVFSMPALNRLRSVLDDRYPGHAIAVFTTSGQGSLPLSVHWKLFGQQSGWTDCEVPVLPIQEFTAPTIIPCRPVIGRASASLRVVCWELGRQLFACRKTSRNCVHATGPSSPGNTANRDPSRWMADLAAYAPLQGS